MGLNTVRSVPWLLQGKKPTTSMPMMSTKMSFVTPGSNAWNVEDIILRSKISFLILIVHIYQSLNCFTEPFWIAISFGTRVLTGISKLISLKAFRLHYSIKLLWRSCKKTLIGVEAASLEDGSADGENCTYCTVSIIKWWKILVTKNIYADY